MKCPKCGEEIEDTAGKRKEFNEETRIKCLLWSDRHCCLCGKPCGTDIEIHHIDQVDDNSIENAIPLCYNCHAEIHRYSETMGSKYKPKELKERRNQIYEKYTTHLVPPIRCEITQKTPLGKRKFPDVGFNLYHLGDSLPVKVKIKLRQVLGKKDLGPIGNTYYAGKKLWNLNPRRIHYGHFSVPNEVVKRKKDRFEIRVEATIIDQYEREHNLLPEGWVYVRRDNDWYFEP